MALHTEYTPNALGIKVVPVHDLQAYRGNKVKVPLIFNLGSSWRWVVRYHSSAASTLPRLVRPQCRSGSCHLPGTEPRFLDVRKSVHHGTIRKEKIQQDATMYQNFIILYLYETQHVSGDTPPIIRSLKLHWQPLVFHTWKVAGRVVGGHWPRPPTTRPTTFHVWKTRGCQCSFRLL